MLKALVISAAALALASTGAAHAQNAPLSGLAPRGAVQASDIIPIMPSGGAQLMQTTVGAIIAPATAGATGTVQSVNLTLPGAFTCAGGPITTSGTIACTLANQSANTFLAGPASGAAATPTFRAIGVGDLFGGAGATSSTFLRGDGTWATAGGGSVTSVTCGAGLTGGTFTTSGDCALATALPNGTTGTTQSLGDNTADVATDAFVNAAVSSASGGDLKLLATYTVSGSSTTDIPLAVAGGYTNLEVDCQLRSSVSGTGADQAIVIFNGDTTAGHYYGTLIFTQSTTSIPTWTAQNNIGAALIGDLPEAGNLSGLYSQAPVLLSISRSLRPTRSTLQQSVGNRLIRSCSMAPRIEDRIIENLRVMRESQAPTSRVRFNERSAQYARHLPWQVDQVARQMIPGHRDAIGRCNRGWRALDHLPFGPLNVHLDIVKGFARQ